MHDDFAFTDDVFTTGVRVRPRVSSQRPGMMGVS